MVRLFLFFFDFLLFLQVVLYSTDFTFFPLQLVPFGFQFLYLLIQHFMFVVLCQHLLNIPFMVVFILFLIMIQSTQLLLMLLFVLFTLDLLLFFELDLFTDLLVIALSTK